MRFALVKDAPLDRFPCAIAITGRDVDVVAGYQRNPNLNRQEHDMSTSTDRAPAKPDIAHGYDPPEPVDDAPIAPFDPTNEERELSFCEENPNA